MANESNLSHKNISFFVAKNWQLIDSMNLMNRWGMVIVNGRDKFCCCFYHKVLNRQANIFINISKLNHEILQSHSSLVFCYTFLASNLCGFFICFLRNNNIQLYIYLLLYFNINILGGADLIISILLYFNVSNILLACYIKYQINLLKLNI